MDLPLALASALSGGGLLAIGAAANARLATSLRSAVAAATVNFLVGASGLGLLLALGILPAVPLQRLAAVPPWTLWGGSLGALYVTLNTLVIPRLGLTATTMAVVVSQLVCALLIDQGGWLGVPQRPGAAGRWLAVLLLLLAVALRQGSAGAQTGAQAQAPAPAEPRAGG